MLTPLPDSQWNRDNAAHLLRRAGFGSNPEQLDSWSKLKLDEAVNRLVDWQQIPDLTQNPDWAKPDPTLESKREELRMMSEEDRKKAVQMIGRSQREHVEELRLWWLTRMFETTRPLQEKMTLFWHGHFATSVEKVKDAYFMWKQNDLFRRLGNGNFEELLVEGGREPAMLVWLDGGSSNLRAPNENYAREVMELFTLGEGHYTEDDIKNAAKAFTGWVVEREKQASEFRPQRFSNEPKTFKGQTGNFNDKDVVHLILQDPNCGAYLAKKIWTFFAYENPEPELLGALADRFRSAKYEIKPLLRTLFLSEEFYSQKSVRNQIKSPVQWLVGCCKSLDFDRIPRLAPNALRLLGQDLLAPPSVKGWDGGRNWISTATLLQRCNIARFMIYGGNPASMGILPPNLAKAEEKGKIEIPPGQQPAQPGQPVQPGQNPPPPMDEKMERKNEILQRLARVNIPPMVQVQSLVPPEALSDKKKLITALSQRLYQSPLNPQLEKACEDYLGGDAKPVSNEKIQGLLYLMMTRPEFQLG